MEPSGGNSDPYRNPSSDASAADGSSRRYRVQFSASNLIQAPLSALLEYSGILRTRSSHAEGEGFVARLDDSAARRGSGGGGGGGGGGEVAIRIIGAGEHEGLRLGDAPHQALADPIASASERRGGGDGGGGEGIEEMVSSSSSSSSTAPLPPSISAVGSQNSDGEANAAGANRDVSNQRYDIQQVARWIEQILPFSLLLLVVFISQHLQGFFVTIWIAAVMFKSNDILWKQTALKASQNNQEFISCSPCSQAYLASSSFLYSFAEESGSNDKCKVPNVDINVLGVSEFQRKLVGEGSHRNLVSTLRFIECSDAMIYFLHTYDCEVVVIERLPRGVFADLFELQRLVNRRVFSDVAVFGDTNLELPSAFSNKSIVEIHMHLRHDNLLSNCEIVIELPLHARYPPLDVSGYATVDIDYPALLLRFRPNEASSNSCFWSVTPIDVGPAKMVKWQIPCGNEAYSGIVSTITFVSALVGALLIVFSVVFYSPENFSKIL